jgi:hypothetical protein
MCTLHFFNIGSLDVNFEFYINEGAHPRTRRNNVDPDLGSTFLPRLVSTFFLRQITAKNM